MQRHLGIAEKRAMRRSQLHVLNPQPFRFESRTCFQIEARIAVGAKSDAGALQRCFDLQIADFPAGLNRSRKTSD
jgi:hypothetical protein